MTTNDDLYQSVIIHTLTKKNSVLIQTDKAMYKPGDVVKYRVLILDSSTKPYDYNKLTIQILDLYGAVLEENDVSSYTLHGEMVQKREFRIPEDTILGNWAISVQVDDDIESVTKQTFEVKEYVLPRFEAFIDTETNIVNEQDLKLSVFAKYNFGEFVKGKATIKLMKYDSGVPDVVQKKLNFAIENIDTKKVHAVNLNKDLDIFHVVRPFIIKVEMEFEEEMTKRIMYANETITIGSPVGFAISVNRPKLQMKPGFPYEINVIVRGPDGKIITGKEVKVKAELYYDYPKCTKLGDTGFTFDGFFQNKEKKLINGMAEFTIDVPKNTSAMILTVSFFDMEKTVNVTRFPSKSREYLMAKILTTK